MELLKGLLKWIILIILLVIVIILIIKMANKNTTNNKKKDSTVNVVENNNTNNTEIEEETEINSEDDEDGLIPVEDDLIVDSPNTASTGVRETLIGILITCGGLIYIRKNKTVEENS